MGVNMSIRKKILDCIHYIQKVFDRVKAGWAEGDIDVIEYIHKSTK